MTCVSRLPHYFQLRAGAEVLVPPWFRRIIHDSVNAAQFPETPKFLFYERVDEGFYTFVEPAKNKGAQTKGYQRLFVPGNLQVGDVLTIEWVDDNRRTAKAVHKQREDWKFSTSNLPVLLRPAPDHVVPNCS